MAIPDLWKHGSFDTLGGITPGTLLFWGSFVILGTLGISLYQLAQIHKQPAHKSMLDISEIIFQTCKTYLIQQGKFLLMLFVFIASAITYYLVGFGHAAEDEYEEIGRRSRNVRHVPDRRVVRRDV